MAPPLTTLGETHSTWLSEWLKAQRLPTAFQATALAGDGSTRTFYRIEVAGKSFILLSDPAWILSKDYPAHQQYLKKNGISVPEFFAVSPAVGCLLMEDLGDELLQYRIVSEPQTKGRWLEKATELLAHLHGRTYPVDPAIPATSRKFDAKKYFEEFSFTLEHLHQGLLQLGAPPAPMLGSLKRFCEELETLGPAVFSHRDYHTRNLLVHKDQLCLIDFQDARLGPVHYDLVSLFFDAYVPIEGGLRSSLLDLYWKTLRPYPLYSQLDQKAFSDELLRVAFQRVVKAAGSFASFYTRYGKTTHLPYLAPALRSALEIQSQLKSTPSLPLEVWIRKVEKGIP